MNLSITIMEMLNQRDVFNLVCIGIVFCLMIFVISRLDRFEKAAENNVRGSSQPAYAAAQNAGDQSEVTAAISAAVSEYRKNK